MNLINGIVVAYGIPIEKITEIVCKDETWVLNASKAFAKRLGVTVKTFACGPELGAKGKLDRDAKMAAYSNGLLLIWNCHSKGSNNMLSEANKRGLPVWNVILSNAPTKRDLKQHRWIGK